VASSRLDTLPFTDEEREQAHASADGETDLLPPRMRPS